MIEFDAAGRAKTLEEKPKQRARTTLLQACTFTTNVRCQIAAELKPSARGELEITDLNRQYLQWGELRAEVMGRGIAWLDTGTHDSLLDASTFIATIEKAAGTEGVVSRRDRVAHGLHRS